MPTLIILRGIPLSGKSTWAESMLNENIGFSDKNIPIIISRDEIRMSLFKCRKYSDYKFSSFNENLVTNEFNKQFKEEIKAKNNIILDNTNLLPRYYRGYIDIAQACGYIVEFKDFPISLWKAHFRNIMRWVKTGKWIPWKVMKNMYKNFKKLNNGKI